MRPALSLELGQRWPDRQLSEYFQTLLQLYGEILAERTNGVPFKRRLDHAHEILCARFLQSAQLRLVGNGSLGCLPQNSQGKIFALIQNLHRTYESDWLQAAASMFGMLMHFSLSKPSSQLLVNRRRPKQPVSSYPNSPSLARLLADRVLSQLFTRPIPTNRVSAQAASRYAELALAFRVIDPSMESGQLLLELARGVVDRVHRAHAPSSKSAAFLKRAVLEKLCSSCLWGVDRNAQAIEAVQLAFALFSRDCGIGELWPANLLTADTLALSQDRMALSFDGVINNPPWGDSLRAVERRALRNRFSTLKHHTDTYIAFGELALRWLRPSGIFALVLPSQMLATQNTSKLRRLFARETQLDEIIVLPRSAFAQATVRGVVMIGRRLPSKASRRCRIVVYPLIKDLATVTPVRTSTVPGNLIRAAASESWWPLVAGTQPLPTVGPCIPLSKLSRIISGVKVYARGEGRPPQTATVVRQRWFDLQAADPKAQPAIRGRDIRDFYLERPARHIKLGEWLAHEGEHAALRGSTRIFVRELCRRDGKLTAAIAQNGMVPLHGVLTIIPQGIDPHILTAILNSQSFAYYVRGTTASFSKVDFQKITLGELQQMPIPAAVVEATHRSVFGLPPATRKQLSLQRRLIKIAKTLSRQQVRENKKTFAQSEAIVQTMYWTA